MAALLLSPSDSSVEVERLLRLPLSPGAVALLAPYSTDPAVQARYAEALRDPRPETRAVAARAIHVIGAPLREEVERALSAESNPEAAREEIRAMSLFAQSPELDAKLREAAARFGGRLDFDVLHAVARRRGDQALPFYYAWSRDLSLGIDARKSFFRIASRGARETLIAVGTRALENAEAPTWTAALELLQEDPQDLPSSLLRSALESRSDEIRGPTAWALLPEWISRTPSWAPQLLPALSPRPESTNVETEFGVELLARVLGRAPAENAAWIAHVQTKGTERWTKFLKGSPFFKLLTEGEKDAVRRKHWPDTPKGFKDSVTAVALPPTPTARSAVLRLTSSLPTGSLADLLSVAGCRPGSRVDLGEAQITYGYDGRPRAISWRLPGEESCAAAARALFLLALLPAGDLARPDRPELVLAIASRKCSQTLEEPPVEDVAAAGGASGNPLRVGGDVAAPKLVDGVEPRYPASARTAGLEGIVIVEAIIGTNGCVLDPLVLKSAATELDREALIAVSQWRYKPATLNGRPVRVYLTVTVTFNLDERPSWGNSLP